MIRLQAGEGKRYALAIVAGMMWAAAFPKIGVAGLAWIAPGLMLAAAIGAKGGAPFRIGYVAGLTHFLASLYWLLWIPVTGLPIGGWLALSAFLALYPATWVWLCWRMYPVRLEEERTVSALMDRFLAPSWAQRLWWGLGCAALWVSWEMAQARVLSGFPWNFLGASQYQMLPLIEVASVTGVYGVSFMMVWFSAALLGTQAMLLRRPEQRSRWLAELIVPLVVVAAVAWFGFRQLFHPKPERPTLKMALVQPSIPQKWIWDAAESSRRFEQLLQLSRRALTNHPDVLVWPEAAVPYMVRYDEEVHAAVTNLVRTHHTWIVLGSDDVEVRGRSTGEQETNVFNSAFLVSPEGKFAPGYRKRRLVIFGEYYPLKRWLPFLDGLGEFTPGDRVVPFHLAELGVKTAVLICFEDVFPHLVREYVDEDTDFLLNLTNNGWFGESAAQWQHAANAVFRAVENGLPLVRCANNGLTCWVDEQGRMNEVYFPDTRDVYGAGFKIAQVPLLAGARRAPTFYRGHGDWFGWGCVGLAALGAGLNRAGRKRTGVFT